MSALALTVNGVLRRVTGGTPIPTGRDLYYSFAPQFQVILLADRKDEQEELNYWLEIEGLQDHAMVVYPDAVVGALAMPERRLAQVTYCSSQRHDITLVVEPDPAVSRLLFENGYTTMTFSHQSYSLPEWRPDFNFKPYDGEADPTGEPKKQKAVPWDDLQQQVAHNAWLRERDKRKDTQDAK